MGVSGVSGGSSSYLSPEAAAAARVVQVLKRQQDVARDVGQALVELISDAAPEAVGGRFSVRA
jgi:predicted component of type VI protein secretion system